MTWSYVDSDITSMVLHTLVVTTWVLTSAKKMES